MATLNSISILDGSYFLHRALKLEGVFELKNSKGVKTGGIFGFLRMISKEIRGCGESFPIVVFDMGLCQRRVFVDSNYKHAKERANQDKQVLTPEEADNDYVTQYRKQRNLLSVLLPYMGIPAIKFSGWEGDDLICILSKISNKSVIYSDDRDLLQLLSDTCSVRRPIYDEFWTLDGFLTSYGYSNTHEFVVSKALLGDNSDNIPGACDGVGHGTVSDLTKIVLKHLDDPESYPRTEKDMRKVCESLGVNYRKAFCNWNIERYERNMKLVDLDLVNMDSQIVLSILSTIKNSEYSENYFKAMSFLSNLEVRDFSLDDLIASVRLKRKYLWE